MALQPDISCMFMFGGERSSRATEQRMFPAVSSFGARLRFADNESVDGLAKDADASCRPPEMNFVGFRSRKPDLGDEDMVCPSKGTYPTKEPSGCGMRPKVCGQTLVRVSSLLRSRGSRVKAVFRRAPAAGSAGCTSHSFQPWQMAPFVPPCRAPGAFQKLILGDLGGSGSSARALPKRVLHGQQNAHRCRPPGRDPGGGAPW